MNHSRIFCCVLLVLLLLIGTVSAYNYTIQVQALTNSPADNVITYLGNSPAAPTTTAGRKPIYIPVSGTITAAEIYEYSGTAGSNEAYSYYIRKNNAEDTLIATLSVSANERVFSNTGLSMAVSAGDYIEIKRVHPANWATNPLTNVVGGYITVTTSTPGYTLFGQGLTNSPGDSVTNYLGHKPGAPVTSAGRARIYAPAEGVITAVTVNEYSGTAGTNEAYQYGFNVNGGSYVFVQSQTLNTNLRTFTNYTENTAISNTSYMEFSRKHPAWVTNPLTNIVGALAFVNTTTSNDPVGYPVYVQKLTSTLTDAQTNYIGMLPRASSTTADTNKIYFRDYGTIKKVEIYTYSGTAGTSESWSIYVRKNNTEDFLIATNAVSASQRRFTNTSINIPITPGDYIEIKSVQPTWVTNPATSIWGGYVWMNATSPPVADFTSNVTVGYAPLSVGFTDTTTNSPDTWSWAYKNETVGWTQFSTSQNPEFTFPEGLYDINLTATNAGGSDDEIKTYYIGANRAAIRATNTSDDGMGNYHEYATWSQIWGEDGNFLTTEGDVTYFGPSIDAIDASNQYIAQTRGGLIPNTSIIPDDATITGAKVYLKYWYGENGLGNPTIGFTGFSPATPGTMVAGDYDTFDSTLLSSNLSWGDLIPGEYSSMTLNAAGISAINKTGYLNLMLRTDWDMNNTAPGWVSSVGSKLYFYTAETGESKTPFLLVNFTAPGGGNPPTASFTVDKIMIRFPNIITCTDTSTETPTSWEWSWGDGTANSTTQNPSHQYTKRGMYTINMAATNGDGTGVASSQTVRVVGYDNLW